LKQTLSPLISASLVRKSSCGF